MVSLDKCVVYALGDDGIFGVHPQFPDVQVHCGHWSAVEFNVNRAIVVSTALDAVQLQTYTVKIHALLIRLHSPSIYDNGSWKKEKKNYTAGHERIRWIKRDVLTAQVEKRI